MKIQISWQLKNVIPIGIEPIHMLNARLFMRESRARSLKKTHGKNGLPQLKAIRNEWQHE